MKNRCAHCPYLNLRHGEPELHELAQTQIQCTSTGSAGQARWNRHVLLDVQHKVGEGTYGVVYKAQAGYKTRFLLYYDYCKWI